MTTLVESRADASADIERDVIVLTRTLIAYAFDTTDLQSQGVTSDPYMDRVLLWDPAEEEAHPLEVTPGTWRFSLSSATASTGPDSTPGSISIRANYCPPGPYACSMTQTWVTVTLWGKGDLGWPNSPPASREEIDRLIATGNLVVRNAELNYPAVSYSSSVLSQSGDLASVRDAMREYMRSGGIDV